MLAVLAQATALGALVLAAGSRSGRFSSLRTRMVQAVGPQALTLAAVVALVSSAGSLYLSEVAGFPPCKLCWYQRIAMYPLVVILALAARHKDYLVARYVVPLCAIGGAISAYHILIERNPSLEAGACDPNNPCSLIWVEHLGYVTIPVMALSGFALIILLTLAGRAWSRTDGGPID